MIGMKISGGPQFAKALQALPFEKSRGLLVKILKHAAEPVRERMEQLAPVEPGKPDLKDAIVVQSVRKIDDGTELEARVLDDSEAAVAIGPSKDAFYGIFQEYGVAPHGTHPGNRPQPFARPAWDEQQLTALKIVQDDIWAHLRNTAVRSPSGRGESFSGTTASSSASIGPVSGRNL